MCITDIAILVLADSAITLIEEGVVYINTAMLPYEAVVGLMGELNEAGFQAGEGGMSHVVSVEVGGGRCGEFEEILAKYKKARIVNSRVGLPPQRGEQVPP